MSKWKYPSEAGQHRFIDSTFMYMLSILFANLSEAIGGHDLERNFCRCGNLKLNENIIIALASMSSLFGSAAKLISLSRAFLHCCNDEKFLYTQLTWTHHCNLQYSDVVADMLFY